MNSIIKPLRVSVVSDVHEKETLERSIRLNIARAIVSKDPLNKERITYNPKIKGVYIIYLISTGHIYIGSTNDLYSRRNQHIFKLTRGISSNKNLQKSYVNVDNIIFIIYPTKTRELAFNLEQKFLDCYVNDPRLLNIATDARLAAKGVYPNEETRAKFKAAMKIRTSNPEHGANISRHVKKRFLNQNEKQKQSDRIKNAWANPVTRIKMLAANKRKGKPVTIDDVIYPSIIDASKVHHLDSTIIIRRLRSLKYPSWRYLNETT